MVKLCLMASHGYHPGVVFHPELGFGRVSKDCQTFWHNPGQKHDIMRLDTLNTRPHQSEEPWKPISGFPETIQFVEMESTVKKPVLIDVQDTRPNSTLFSFGIAEQCTRHEKILQFLMSGSNDIGGGELDLSMLSELIGLQAFTAHNSHQNPCAPDYGSCTQGTEVQPSIVYPSIEFKDQGPLLDFVGNLVQRSDISLGPDGQVLLAGTGTKLKDILSTVAEYYLANNSTKWRKQTVLIPPFNSEAMTTVHESNILLENVKFAPLKSPEKIKRKPSPKQKTSKKMRDRDLYSKNYFHACESLLSIIVDKKHNGKTAILSLKKSGPELPELLTQFSASIAGTGIAVLFSVVCKLAYTRVPFGASKFFNTGIGLGLVWLSWAVNRLRDTVVDISKNSGKLNLKEEEMMGKLDRSVNDVFFRAAALMVVAVLRLA